MITINYEDVALQALSRAGGAVRGPLLNAIREIEPSLEQGEIDEVVAIAFRLSRARGTADEQRSLRPPRQVTIPDAGTSTPEGSTPEGSTPEEAMPREKDGMSPKQRALVIEVVQKMAGENMKDIKTVLRDQVGLIVPVPLIKQLQKGGESNGNGRAPKKRTKRRQPVRRGVKGKRAPGGRRPVQAEALVPAEELRGAPVLQLFRTSQPGMVRILIDVIVDASTAGTRIDRVCDALATGD